MALRETLQLMICHLWTVSSILVRNNISIYDYFQTCLLKKTCQGNQHLISTNIPKYSQFYYFKYINPGRD